MFTKLIVTIIHDVYRSNHAVYLKLIGAYVNYGASRWYQW